MNNSRLLQIMNCGEIMEYKTIVSTTDEEDARMML